MPISLSQYLCVIFANLRVQKNEKCLVEREAHSFAMKHSCVTVRRTVFSWQHHIGHHFHQKTCGRKILQKVLDVHNLKRKKSWGMLGHVFGGRKRTTFKVVTLRVDFFLAAELHE